MVRAIHGTAGGTIVAAFDVDPPPHTGDPAVLALRPNLERWS